MSHAPAIEVHRLGREGQPVVVVDGFAPEPERLAAAGRAAELAPMGPYYPGVRARAAADYFEGLVPVLAPVLRDVFGATGRVRVDRALYSVTTLQPEQLSLAQRLPHIDGVAPGMMAVIHYLGPRDLGGTAFFRHRTTGFEFIDAGRHRAYLDALARDLRAHGAPPPGYIDGSTPLFEEIGRFDGDFNRALIYRGGLLHCARPAPEALGADAKVSRLTVASFLSVA